MERTIHVFRDWEGDRAAELLGVLHSRPGRTGEIFEFAFDAAALKDSFLRAQRLDPDLVAFTGPQFPKAGRTNFGMFEDSSPDRWGQTLIRRRFARRKREGLVAHNARLTASDFLLGVHDAFRIGGLRLKTVLDGPFLDDDEGSAAPPFVRLRELEFASRSLETDANDDDPAVDDWLRLLLAPGASLGGARPKSTVVDPDGHLWIAKFPSANDTYDVGAWEFVVQKLAERAGLRVPASDARTFASSQHTFSIRRFDRRDDGTRIHFASAMNLTGHVDGDDATSGASYLEIADVVATQGAAPDEDLVELWTRIAFNVMVSNTDDHLRNHGFLLSPRGGWRLSPSYDLNPVPDSSGLSLNIDENDNALDLDLVRSVAPYFRLRDAAAKSMLTKVSEAVRGWRDVADSLGIRRSEQQEMSDAFSLATSVH